MAHVKATAATHDPRKAVVVLLLSYCLFDELSIKENALILLGSIQFELIHTRMCLLLPLRAGFKLILNCSPLRIHIQSSSHRLPSTTNSSSIVVSTLVGF
jgi:hypothetical protein